MLFIPAQLWHQAMSSLHGRPHDRERVAFLDGPRLAIEGAAVATTLVLPAIRNTRGNYEVSAADMSRAGGHFEDLEMRRLGQIHSHPSEWTGHSEHDDQFAFSRRDGALSIVVPHYAACAPGLHDCGVHVCQNGTWHQLPQARLQEWLLIVPSLLDFRA
jgi:hypothetical protein